jgi:hypothetical protein
MFHLAWLFLGTYSFYVINSSGLGFTADSGYYSTVAYALRAHQGFSHHGSYWTVFPPLYPLVLSLSGPSLNPVQFAPLLHSALFGVLLFAVSLQQGYLSARTFLVNLCIPLMVLFSPVFEVASFLWSEALYIVLTTLMFLLLWLLQRRVWWAWLVPLAIVTGLSPVSRYIGVVNIFTATVSQGLILRGRWWTRILQCAAFAFVTAIPLGIWAFRNYSIDQTFFGVRPPSHIPITDNIYRTWVTLSGWFETVGNSHITILWLVVPTIVYAISQVRASIRWRACVPLLLYITVYVAFLNISLTRYVTDPIGTRFLAPVYVPLVLLLGLIITATLERAKRSTRFLMIGALALIMVSNMIHFGKMYYDLPQYQHDLVCHYTFRPPPSANCPPE